MKSAQKHLRELENQSADRQLDLFAEPVVLADEMADDVSGSLIAEKLAQVNPDDLTARQALDLVYELKNLLAK